ncbi:MAG: hypothetical protein L0Z70_10235 [Chloroflexi bacterium]|nr:hypothetical protein [Chloroflexota bacterium]
MRLQKENLLKIGDDFVAQRARSDRSVVTAYLCGSLLGDDYLLGGTVDIDIVLIHLDKPEVEREIIRLTDDVHLDVAHHAQKDYRQPRSLRLHPWLGPTLFEGKALYDPQHFMDFIQASVRGQFNRPEHVIERCRKPLSHARQMWRGLAMPQEDLDEAAKISLYLRAVEHAANAVAGLNGAPLTERRLLAGFAQRAQTLGHAGLAAGLMGMLGAGHVAQDGLVVWLGEWQGAMEALPANAPPRLHPARRGYYFKGMQTILGGAQPHAALWPLLRTWTLAAALLPAGAPGRAAWLDACRHLGLAGAGFAERVEALDAFLDTVDEALEGWARENGE